MANNIIEDNDLDSLPREDPPPAPAGKQPESSLQKQASKGEKVYDTAVYQVINYWINLGSSLAIADYFRNLGGKKYLDGAAKGLGKVFSGGNVQKLESSTGLASSILKTLALCSGGWLLVVPMKLMEDKKRPIVHWLNKKMGVDMTATDGHQETPDEIFIAKEQPAQSWGHAFWRRLQAQLAVSATGLVLDKGFAKTLEHPEMIDGKLTTTLGGEKHFTDKIVGFINKGLKSVDSKPTNFLANHPRAQAYITFGALDTFFTMITAAVMRFTNGAKKAQMPHEIGDAQDPPAVMGTNEIVLLPKGEKVVDEATIAASDDKLAQYKKKPIAPKAPTQKFTDLAKTDDSSLAMGPG